MNMLKVFSAAAVAAAIMALAHAQSGVNVDGTGLALQGYDPVAYFTQNRPVKGKPEHSAEHEGARYQFFSRENLEKFQADPEKYAPQFGGYCAYAVSKGYVAPIDVNAFQIHSGRLLLQNSDYAKRLFNQDEEGNYRAAVANWPKVRAELLKKR